MKLLSLSFLGLVLAVAVQTDAKNIRTYDNDHIHPRPQPSSARSALLDSNNLEKTASFWRENAQKKLM